MKNRSSKAIWVLLGLWIMGMPIGLHAGDIALEADGGIIDSAGRRIRIEAPFQRIISLYPAHAENLFSLGADAQVIGVSAGDGEGPEGGAKTVFSYHDDLEKFLSARPDLVLIRPMIDRGYGRLMDRLDAQGIQVVSLQPGSVEQMFVYWKVLGKLAGRSPAAEAMIEKFQQCLDTIRSRTSAIEKKKRVYFEAIHDQMRTFAAAAMPIFALEAAGGVNVAAGATPRRGTNIADFGKERILSQGEAIDVYLAQVGPMNRPSVENIAAEPGYGLIRAVRTGEIHLIDETLVSRPTPALLLGIQRIGRILYPDIFMNEFSDIDCFRPADKAPGALNSKETHP